MYRDSVNFYIFEKKSCQEIQFCWEPGYLTHLLGCTYERKNKRLSKYTFRKVWYKCQICVNKPQSPQSGILLPGWVKRYEWHFWTASAFCDLGQQADLYTKTILVLRRCWIFKDLTMILRSLQPWLICAIYHTLV